MPKRIKVYLAGPMTGCNDDQKINWRRDMKRVLQKAGFDSLDPTTQSARRGAMAVAPDIEEADLVIANMWKESIGTVLGIVHAQRLGIPVILIDRNFMNSPVLEALVDVTVRNENAAVNILRNELAKKLFSHQITIVKRKTSGDLKREAFSPTKLQKSLKTSCTLAGIDNPVFCTMLFQRVKRSILTTFRGQAIASDEIRSLIFKELSGLSSENQSLRPADQGEIQQHAAKMREIWEEYEFNKEFQHEQDETEKAYIEEIESLKEKNDALSEELIKLRLRVYLRPSTINATPDEAPQPLSVTMASRLQMLLNNRRALCVSRIGHPSFQSAFGRLGLETSDFERFFTEEQVDGKQSNLNHNLKNALPQYSYVLYAGQDLRHISDPKLKRASNFIAGCSPSDAIGKLMRK